MTTLATPHIAGYSLQGKAMGTTLSVRAVAAHLGLPIDPTWYPAEAPVQHPRSDLSWEWIAAHMPQHYDIRRDDTALRREFTRATDERNRCIRQKAAQSAAAVLFILLYIVLLAAGLFAPVLFLFCLAGILAFAALYLIFYLYYNRVL